MLLSWVFKYVFAEEGAFSMGPKGKESIMQHLEVLVLVPSVVTLGAFCHPLVLTHLWPWPDRLGLAAACGMKE